MTSIISINDTNGIGIKIPIEKEPTLNSIVTDLKKVEGIVALALGGSYATGDATESSDLDIGLYYSAKNPFNIDEIRSIARNHAVDEPTVTGFYEWGPWVNGGAWIETKTGKIDFLYKNIEQVRATLEKAANGEWENHFEQQPPYGFSSLIYLGETKCCIPLYDPTQVIAKLKAEVQVYPPKLKETVIQYSLWSLEFTLWHAELFCKKQDIYNTMGCLTRGVKNIVNALFAINELYPIGDKRSIEILEKANSKPSHVKNRIEKILCAEKETISENINLLRGLFEETIEFSDRKYKSFYKLKRE